LKGYRVHKTDNFCLLLSCIALYKPARILARAIVRSESKMKTLTFVILCFASVAFAEDFKAISGKEYKNVKVSRVEPDGIVLISKSGISKVYFTELPKEVQDRFHYDAAQAAAYSAEQTASQVALQTQQAELRRKLAEEKNRYWTGQEPAKNQQDTLSAPPAVVAGRGQQVKVISHGAPVDISKHLALGSVTVVDFYADWCGPCRHISPSLEQMARTDPEIALRKIDIVNWKTAVVKQYNIRSIPQVNIYNRGGRLVGTVVGADIQEVKRYVAQAKTSG
jgi:thiol-disulfide isomerase/thioredoxin